jgi:hypothetical protein
MLLAQGTDPRVEAARCRALCTSLAGTSGTIVLIDWIECLSLERNARSHRIYPARTRREDNSFWVDCHTHAAKAKAEARTDKRHVCAAVHAVSLLLA